MSADLSVTFIEMTPKYPAYIVDYDEGATNPRPSEASAAHSKHWPAPGEEITFSAHIRSQGGEPSEACHAQWLLDGEPYGEAITIDGLAVGEEIVLTSAWPWEAVQHEMALSLDTTDLSAHNNARTIHTYALNLIMVCDPDTYEGFAAVPNVMGSYSWEDWAQAHVAKMNRMFEEAIYPVTPNGCSERVRIDRILVASQDEWTGELNTRENPCQFQGHDGAWFYRTEGDFPKRAEVMDWGLIHELGHQLGLIDEYQLDVGWENNRVPGPDGDPVLIGYYGSSMDSMMHGHGPVPWSDFAAIHMESQLHRRRGFYGDVQFSIPAHNEVCVLDAEGNPVPEATLSFHQKTGAGGPSTEATFVLTTNTDGIAELPNRDIGVEPYSPVGTDYLYRDNPFGPIGIVGGNNVFFIKVEARGHVEYHWLDIMHFVRAFYTGHADHWRRPIQTRIPTNEILTAPTDVHAAWEANGAVRITWEPSSCPSTVRHEVYRALPPYFEWERLGSARMPGAEFIDADPPDATLLRYAVTARDPGLHESAFSRWFAVPILREPGGLTVLPDGRLLLADHARGQLLWLRDDLSVIGPFNSVHHHLYPFDVTVGPGGTVVATDLPDGYDPRSGLRFMGMDDATREHTAIPPFGKPQGTRDPHPDESYRLEQPTGVFVDEQGILVTDAANGRLLAYTPEREAEWTVQGLSSPSRAVRLPGDIVAVAEAGSNQIRILENAGGEQMPERTLQGFSEPGYLIAAADGSAIYVSDTGAGRVVKVSLEGQVLEEYTTDLAGVALDRPVGLALSDTGKLYVVDAGSRPRVAALAE